MRPQSRGSLNCGNFGTLTWQSWDKKSFGCGPPWRGAEYTIRGKVVASPNLGRDESYVFGLPVARLSTKNAQTMH
jgi:hypothetical protein